MANGKWRRAFRLLREAEWITSLLRMSGISGLITGSVGGIILSIWSFVIGLPGPVAVFVGFGVLTFLAVIVAAVRTTAKEIAPKAGMSETVMQGVIDPLEKVEGRSFRNETVIIDGRHYVDCDFTDCFIQYGGGPWAIKGLRLHGINHLVTTNPMAGVLQLASALGFMKTDFTATRMPELPRP